MSLKLLLEKLGYDPCHHMKESAINYSFLRITVKVFVEAMEDQAERVEHFM